MLQYKCWTSLQINCKQNLSFFWYQIDIYHITVGSKVTSLWTCDSFTLLLHYPLHKILSLYKKEHCFVLVQTGKNITLTCTWSVLSHFTPLRTLHLPVHDQSSLSCTHFTPFSTFKSHFCCFNSLVNISFWCALHLWSTAKQYVLGSWNKLLHSMNRALWYTYMRMTNKMHTFLHNLFHLIYPRHVSNK